MVILMVVLSVRTLYFSVIFTTLYLFSEKYLIFLFIVSFLIIMVTGPFFSSFLFKAAYGHKIS
jgi:multisubunit Na+/H+ antiporter MnhG subunit